MFYSMLGTVFPLTLYRDSEVFSGISVGSVPFTVKGVSGQTAHIFDVKNSAGTVLFGVDPSGNLTIAGTATITINEAVTGTLNVTGAAIFNSTASFAGAVTISSDLTSTGNQTFGVIGIGQTEVKNNLVVDNALSVSGQSYLSGNVTFGSNVFFNGGVTPNSTKVNTATYTVAAADYILLVQRTSTGACTITLPAASVAKRLIYIQDYGGNAQGNNITINPAGADTINAGTSYTINANYNSITLYSDGVSIWSIL